MTDLEICIAIERILGFEVERRTRRGNPDPNGVQLWRLIEHHGGVAIWRRSSNYCTDLNAMHEAEKVIAAKGVNAWWIYCGNIIRSMPPVFGGETAVMATARQRAEAFLRTLGKWTK